MVKWDVGGIQSVHVKEGTLWLLELNSTEECWEQRQLTLTCAFGLSHWSTEKPGCLDSYFHSYLVERFSQGTLILHGQQGKGLRSNKVFRQCGASIGYRNRVMCSEGVRPKGHAGTSTALPHDLWRPPVLYMKETDISKCLSCALNDDGHLHIWFL